MATTRLIPMHVIKGQTVAHTVHERLSYAINPEKTNSGQLVKAYAVNWKPLLERCCYAKKNMRPTLDAVKRRRATSFFIRSGSP